MLVYMAYVCNICNWRTEKNINWAKLHKRLKHYEPTNKKTNEPEDNEDNEDSEEEQE